MRKVLHSSIVLFYFLFTVLCVKGQENEKVNINSTLQEVRSGYYQKKERKALSDLNSALSLKIRKLYTKNQLLSLMAWKVRIHYKLRESQVADSVLREMFGIDDDLDYDQFEDPKEHFKAFFNRVLNDYDQGFVFVNKYREDASTTPATVSIYSREDIDRLGIRNLIDLLRITPGFAEVGDSNERNIGTRGVYGTTTQHILFLINGHRVNDLFTSTNSPDWFSLDYVEQVEVMRGPGSALYGGNAFSGVINIITKTGKDLVGSQMRIQIGNGNAFRDLFDIPENQYKVNYQYGARLRNRDKLYLSATLAYSGGSRYDYDTVNFDFNKPHALPDIIGDQEIAPPNADGTEYINRTLPGYNFLINYLSGKLDVTVNAQSSVLVIHRPGSSNLWDKKSIEELKIQSRKDTREFIQMNYELMGSQTLGKSLSLKLSFDHFHKDLFRWQYASYHNNPSDTSLAEILGDEYRWTSSVQFDTDRWGFFKNKNSRSTNESVTIMGLTASLTDWYYSYLVSTDDQQIFRSNPATNFFEKESDNENIAAFFVQTAQHLISDRLIGTVGFRLNYHPIYSDFSKVRWTDEVSPRLSFVYLTKHDGLLIPNRVKLLYNSAFLPPAFLYRRGGITGFRAASGLVSQTTESIELNVLGHISSDLTYSVNHFVNQIDNFLLRNVDVYQNDMNVRRLSGWELSFEHTIVREYRNWSSKAFLNFSTTRLKTLPMATSGIFKTVSGEDYRDTSLLYYPEYTLHAGVRSSLMLSNQSEKKVEFGLSMNYHGLTRVNSTIGYDATTNSWSGDLGTSETIRQPFPVTNINIRYVSDRSVLGVSFHNLFNTDYRLPSVVSKTGEMRGEKMTILLSYEFRLGSKLN